MVPAKETAEEQLLRMIEGPSPASPKGPPKGFSPERLHEALRDALEAATRWARGSGGRRDGGDPFLGQLQLAARLFWGVLAALGLYLVVDVLVLRPPMPQLPRVQPSAGESGAKPVENAGDRFQAYRQTLISRNPFRLEARRGEEKPAGQTANSKLMELVEPLTVVGINRGAIPEALIEDKGTKRTHFVKIGDQLNGLTISDIGPEGVKVTYEGEETLLK